MFTKSTLAILISAALLAVSTGANAGKEGRLPDDRCLATVLNADALLHCRGDNSWDLFPDDAADAPDAPDFDVVEVDLTPG